MKSQYSGYNVSKKHLEPNDIALPIKGNHNFKQTDAESFHDKELAYNSPRGSIHTNHNLDESGARTLNDSEAAENRGNNKIRVVIRMRPYLDNEISEIRQMSNVQAQGQIKLIEKANAIDVFPNSTYPG